MFCLFCFCKTGCEHLYRCSDRARDVTWLQVAEGPPTTPTCLTSNEGCCGYREEPVAPCPCTPTAERGLRGRARSQCASGDGCSANNQCGFCCLPGNETYKKCCSSKFCFITGFPYVCSGGKYYSYPLSKNLKATLHALLMLAGNFILDPFIL